MFRATIIIASLVAASSFVPTRRISPSCFKRGFKTYVTTASSAVDVEDRIGTKLISCIYLIMTLCSYVLFHS